MAAGRFNFRPDPERLAPRLKKLLFFGVDVTLVPVSLYLACALHTGPTFTNLSALWPLFPMMLSAGLGVVWFSRLHRIKLHAIEARAFQRIGIASVGLAMLSSMLSILLSTQAPASISFIFGSVFFALAVLYRLCTLRVLNLLRDYVSDRQNVAIYGAGAAGMQLASALSQSKGARPVIFLDDNPHLHALMIAGLMVHNPQKLNDLIRKHRITRILLAMPSVSDKRRADIVQVLGCYEGVDVQVLPSFADLLTGEQLMGSLRTVNPDELLGRDRVNLDTPEIAKAYAGRNVLVTGAGGSIGSELCRQLVECRPASITLFDVSEYNLYEIDRTLRPIAAQADVQINTCLGSVTDKARVTQVMSDFATEIVLHAAAYKHVPLVEHNELQGAWNNVMGTRTVAEVAASQKVERFILVSTDKAVRPTNVMGATKRMAEMLVQDVQTRTANSKFSMVRFGNVLGSSGSVLPLFQQQIVNGGPVTVTHPEVTRFFMTIPEAARLVLLAGAFSQGGDVFLLDMGAPQKIVDIARRMIALSGRRVFNPDTGTGDIAINFTGLRPGEKLYEELLINADRVISTPHPKILRAQEDTLSEIEIAAMLRETENCLKQNDPERLRHMIKARVAGYREAARELVSRAG